MYSTSIILKLGCTAAILPDLGDNTKSAKETQAAEVESV